MRTTNNMLINNMMYYMNNNLGRMSKYQQQMATGKKINVPSDDPVVAARALKFRTDVSEVEQFQSNSKDAYSWMEMTESALSKVGDITKVLYERAVQAANGTLTNDDRTKANNEVKQLHKQLAHLANSSYAGRYIFSGYATDTKLMNEDGSYSYSVSSSEVAIVKSGLLDPAIAPIDPATNNSFEISLDGTNYYRVNIANTLPPFDNSASGRMLDDLAKALQDSISGAVAVGTAPVVPPTELKNIKVVNNNGRLEFSLRDLTDSKGNKLKLFMKESVSNDILKKISVRTDPVSKINISKSEDINFQLGIGDVLNVNVLGTDLFGAGVKGDIGTFMGKINSFIDSLSYPNRVTNEPVFVNTSNPLDLTSKNKFSIKIDGVSGFENITITPGIYDGTYGKTMDDLAREIQNKINSNPVISASGTMVNVINQSGKLTFVEKSGKEITLQKGSPAAEDSLAVLNFKVNADNNVMSITGQEGLNNSITDMSSLLDKVLSIRSDIGARMNRSELTLNRLESDELNFTKLMSDNEDIDVAEVIMKLKSEEDVYRASLAGGARVIQPTLIDFLR